jgi:Rrf2 family nitric oxide-sensitive transcriptional repressor
MQLTQFSDYSLRLVLYLAMNDERVVPVNEVSTAYNISHHHLVKVVQRLTTEGLIVTVRGRTGGVRLKRKPEDIRIGHLVRVTEPHFTLVECFEPKTNTCPINHVCGLKQALRSALSAYLDTLDRYTVADFLPRRAALLAVWQRAIDGKVAAVR